MVYKQLSGGHRWLWTAAKDKLQVTQKKKSRIQMGINSTAATAWILQK